MSKRHEVGLIAAVVTNNLFDEIYKQTSSSLSAYDAIAKLSVDFEKKFRHVTDWNKFLNNNFQFATDWEVFVIEYARLNIQNFY